MKSVIIGLIIVILSFLFLLFGLPLINKNSDDCDGFFHHNYCIDQNTSNKTLIKLGLKEEKINETYELRIEYPKIIIKYPKLFEHLKEQAQQIKTDMDYLNTYDSNNKNSIPRSLTILCEESSDFVKFLSVVCRFTEYTEGGNPKHGFFTTNFDIEYKDIVDLEDIFNKDSKALEEISDYVIMQIYKEKSERSGELVAKDDVIERGASPERGNYLNFVFVYDQGELSGINFLFPNFQVGSYAEGSYEVFVPKNVFNAFLVKENKGAKH